MNKETNFKRKFKRFFILNKMKHFFNIEEIDEYNFTLNKKHTNIGVSAMLREKNKEKNIPSCLAGIYNIFNEIIFVDNNSTDNTLYLGQKFKEEKDIQKK